MNELLKKIRLKDASAFTHSGKFHADDVFSSALLLYLNPEITILRGNKVPEDFDGIIFDIGRGRYDHHQKDSRGCDAMYETDESTVWHQLSACDT